MRKFINDRLEEKLARIPEKQRQRPFHDLLELGSR